MSGASSPRQLLDPGLALGTYLDDLLSDSARLAGSPLPPRAATSDAVAAPAAQSPAPVQDRLQVRLFQVAGLTLAVPLARVKDIVTSDADLAPSSQAAPPLLGLLSYPGGESRVVDTAGVILPSDATAVRQANHFVVLDAGRWALACDRIADVIEIQHSDVRWRTAAGKRPWLAGTVMKQKCALLDIDALVGQLSEQMA